MKAELSGRARLRSVRGVLFDKDGTLLDYAASWTPINRRAARIAAAGDAALEGHLLHVGGADPATGRVNADSALAAGSAADIAALWVRSGAPFEAERLTVLLDDVFRSAATQVVPVADLPALLGRLKAAGLMLGIASSDNEAAVRATAQHLGIDGLIDFVAGYDSGFGPKPGSGMVTAFCAAAGLQASEIAVVGDNTYDMLMARAGGAGLAVGVLTGTGTQETLAPHSDLCLPSIVELADLLLGAGDEPGACAGRNPR